MADLRLLFLCSTLTVGGFERHLGYLVPGLRQRGFEPAVVALREGGPIFDQLREQGIQMRFVGMRSRTDLRGLRRGLHVSGHPDVVISQSIDAHVAAAMLARREAAPHVAVEHAAPELLSERRLHHLVAYRWVAPRVRRAVALSRTQIPGMIGLRYREDSIRVIPNGIPEMRPVRTTKEVRAELGLDERDFVVTLVATLRPEKRGELFVDAVIEASRAEPSVRGVVVGGGPHFERVRVRADANPKIVKVLGERSDVADLIAASDAVGLSSVAECLPLSVLEAMALARPVVGTDVGGMREPVVHGETGLLVAPDDPGALTAGIVQLARDPEQAVAMGMAARRRYERDYTVDTMIDAYSELFGELGSARRGRSAAG
jgi:glycosyltransferase involved in cell wall biosynthesis